MNETAIQFGTEHGLVGVVTDPPEELRDAQLPAVVLLNPGLLHRVGPNRTYVKLARALAAEGYTVVRFDFSGMGDSRPRADHLPYAQSAPAEARAAMDWLARHRDAQHFVLIGHCAGAGIGLLAARDDRRVAGAVLINMEGGDAQWTEFDRKKKVSQQYARDYGQRALVSRERWARLLTGRADYRNIARIVLKDILWYRVTNLGFRAGQLLHARQSSVRAEQAVVAQTYLDPIIERGAGLLLLHSEGSTGLEQIRATLGAELERRLAAGSIQLTIIPASDHMFTLVSRQRQLCDELLLWLRSRVGVPSGQVQTPTMLSTEQPALLALSGNPDGR